MSDPSLDLQGAIIQLLRSTPAVTALVGQRIFDKVPPETPFPFLSYGSDQVLQDDVSCITAYEISTQIDVWSRAVGQPEMKRISGAVRAALHDADLVLDDHALVLLEHEQTRYLDDPDGLTSHGALTFKALVDAISPYPSRQLSIQEVVALAQAAGFTFANDQILAVVAIAISESSLYSANRNWHPEFGYRDLSDVIGVMGPSSVWQDGRQQHSDRGLWQVSSHWWPQYSDRECDTPSIAASIVFAISNGGADFTPWDTFVSGDAQLHYDTAFDGWPALRPIVIP